MDYTLGLIGYPIKHSLSPWIHKQFMKQLKLRGTYSIMEFSTEATTFQTEMDELKQRDVHGFNITVPYKETIIPYLDDIDPLAEKIGAVNTVKKDAGKWIGYNTDGLGYIRSLEDEYDILEKKQDLEILLLGAGGAAKGIYHALINRGYVNVTIANRTIARAEEIIGSNETSRAITLERAEESAHTYDLLIQTTSVGMRPGITDTIINLQSLKKEAIVSDIVYQPLMTAFLQAGEKLEGKIHFGHTMLLYQAQLAFEIWTGKSPDMTGLATKLQQILEG